MDLVANKAEVPRPVICDLRQGLPSTVYARVARATERNEALFYVEALAFLTGNPDPGKEISPKEPV